MKKKLAPAIRTFKKATTGYSADQINQYDPFKTSQKPASKI